jgi:chromosome segregation ATPase
VSKTLEQHNQRLIDLDTILQREMRILDDRVQAEMRLLDEHQDDMSEARHQLQQQTLETLQKEIDELRSRALNRTKHQTAVLERLARLEQYLSTAPPSTKPGNAAGDF